MPSTKVLVLASAITATSLLPAAVPAAAAAAAPAVGTTAALPARSPAQIHRMSIRQLRVLHPRVRLAVARSRIDRSHGYQGERRCIRGNRPGTLAVRNLLKITYARNVAIGLSRGCGGDTSEHYDGRALDWMVNSRRPRQAAQGDAFVRWLTSQRRGVQGAYARRLGVMYIIWRGRMWRSYSPGWRNYNGCARRNYDATSCHYNHVHISLNWAGALKRTSWYRHRT